MYVCTCVQRVWQPVTIVLLHQSVTQWNIKKQWVWCIVRVN